MTNEWKTFLEQQGAHFDDAGVIHFGDINAELKRCGTGTLIVDLSHYGLIRASGEEAGDFLQNQFSNDVRLVNESQAQLSSYCSPKGRMLASFLLFQRGGDYLLRLPQTILPNTLKRLRMFILRTKVSLDDAGDQLLRFGLVGNDARTILASVVEKVPVNTYEVVNDNGVTIITTPGHVPCFEFYGEIEPITQLWKRLSRQATPVGRDCWNWFRIRAGIPEITEETVEAFVPQMANLATLNGVSFKKGCYPGQEVVARMHYLGKLKRRMYLAHSSTNSLPTPGDPLFSSQESEQNIGKIVQAQTSPEGGIDLLAVIQIASAEHELHLDSPDGPLIEIQPLPYTVTGEA